MDTRKALKDIPETEGPALGGILTIPTSAHTVPDNLPLVEYLVRADYYGKTAFVPTTTLGNTTFTVGMLTDSLSQPDVSIFVDQEEPPIDEIGGWTAPTVPGNQYSVDPPASPPPDGSSSTGTATGTAPMDVP
jgi:hypothetical protein